MSPLPDRDFVTRMTEEMLELKKFLCANSAALIDKTALQKSSNLKID